MAQIAAPAVLRPLDTMDTARQILRRWEDLKGIRLAWESTWQELCAYFLPRRDFGLQKFPGELADRRLLDATGMINSDRLAAMLFGFLVNPAMPFVRPSVDQALVASGRGTVVTADGRDYLDGVQWAMHDHFMSARSGFKTSGFECLAEYTALGTGVLMTVSEPGFGARYQALPLQSCWLAANEKDVIDTLYYAFTLPAWCVVQKWPAAAELECVKKASGRSESASIKLLMACEPREGGRKGAFSTAKPWKYVVLAVEDQAVLEEKGYDSFPYAVPRFSLKPGEVYGYGPGHVALADVRMLNAMMESVLRGAELRNDPPIMVPLRLFSRALDRRRGAVNYYQAGQLGIQTANQAVQPLNLAGDPTLTVELIRELRGQIEYAFYTDWMRVRESGNMTATEVNDRRDMRLRGMSPIVGRAESDMMVPAADRTFEINAGMGHYGQAPADLRGLNISWGYTGPMALAQLQQQREGVGITAALAGQLMQIDPIAGKVVDVEEMIRIVGDSAGLPPAALRSREMVEKLRQAQEAQEREAVANQNDQGKMVALRDGAQAVASIANAGGGQDLAMAA